MKVRWLGAALSAVALTIGGPTAAWATGETPPGHGKAVGAQVEDIITLGGTEALVDKEGGTATANGLGLGDFDDTLIEDSTGATQTGEGKKVGALLELEDGPNQSGDTDLELTPYVAEVTKEGTVTEAQAKAAVLNLFLGDLLTLNLLRSESNATFDKDPFSTGDSSSDVLVLCLLGTCDGKDGGDDKKGDEADQVQSLLEDLLGGGNGGGGEDDPGQMLEDILGNNSQGVNQIGQDDEGLEIVVLHSDASSDGTGRSYLLRLGDETTLGDNNTADTNGGSNGNDLLGGLLGEDNGDNGDSDCGLELEDESPEADDEPLLLNLTCVTKSSDPVRTIVNASGIDLGVLGILVHVSAASASGSTGPKPDKKGERPPKGGPDGKLPVTGGNLLGGLLFGSGLLGLGGAVLAAQRVRERVTAKS